MMCSPVTTTGNDGFNRPLLATSRGTCFREWEVFNAFKQQACLEFEEAALVPVPCDALTVADTCEDGAILFMFGRVRVFVSSL